MTWYGYLLTALGIVGIVISFAVMVGLMIAVLLGLDEPRARLTQWSLRRIKHHNKSDNE